MKPPSVAPTRRGEMLSSVDRHRDKPTIALALIAFLICSLVAGSGWVHLASAQPQSWDGGFGELPYMASGVHVTAFPDGSCSAQVAFVAFNNTITVRGIRPSELEPASAGGDLPSGLAALALWARKGSPPSWSSSVMLSSFYGFYGGHGAYSGQLRGLRDPLFSPGLWLLMYFIGLSTQGEMFKDEANSLAENIGAAYGLDMWPYADFTIPLHATYGGDSPPPGANLMAFMFIYYAEAQFDELMDGFLSGLPSEAPCELVQNRTRIEEAPYALMAYAIADLSLACLTYTYTYREGFGEPAPIALEGLEDRGWLTLWLSDFFFLDAHVTGGPEGSLQLSLNSVFGHDGPICSGGSEGRETYILMLVDVPWAKLVSVEPGEAEILFEGPLLAAVSLNMTTGECVEDMVITYEYASEFPSIIVTQQASSYFVEPGEEVEISVLIQNVGSATAYNVTCLLPDYREGGASEGISGVELAPGDSMSFNYTTTVEPECGFIPPLPVIYFATPVVNVTSCWSPGDLPFIAWSNSLQFIRPGDYGASILAFLRLENYTARQGDVLKARLEVWNVGNAPAEDVGVFMSWEVLWTPPSFSPWWGYPPEYREEYYGSRSFIERLGPGEHVELEFNFTALVPGCITAFAGVVFGEGPPTRGSSNSAMTVVVPEPSVGGGLPYLIVEKFVLAEGDVEEGNVLTIVLEVSNVGTAEAKDVLIIDRVPEGLEFLGNVRVSPPDKPFEDLSEGDRVAVQISSLAPGETVRICYDVRAGRAGTFMLSSAEGASGYYGLSTRGASGLAFVTVKPRGGPGGPGALGLPGELTTPLALLVASVVGAGVVVLLFARRKH